MIGPGDEAARLGRGRRRLRHRRRLRRSSRASRWRSSGGVLEAAGFRVAILSQPDWRIVRAVAALRPAAAVLRRQRRQHGLDDQPLHGQPEGAQRRRLQPRRADRPAARPRDARLLPAGPRGVPGRARDRRRRRGQSCAGWPTTTTGATRSAARSCSTARPTSLVFGMGERADRRDRPPARRAARRCATCATCAAWPIGWAPARRRPTDDTLALPSFEEVVDRQAGVRRDDPASPTSETNPYNARRLVQCHGREAVVVNPPALPLTRGGDGPRLRPALHAPAAPELRRAADPRLRGGQGLGADHARLLRRLHVLLDHGPRGADHPEPQPGVGPGRDPRDGRRPGLHGRRSATSAGRRPTCTRCAARGPRSRRSAAG